MSTKTQLESKIAELKNQITLLQKENANLADRIFQVKEVKKLECKSDKIAGVKVVTVGNNIGSAFSVKFLISKKDGSVFQAGHKGNSKVFYETPLYGPLHNVVKAAACR